MPDAVSKKQDPVKIRRVFAVGETVWDIIFKDGLPVTARAGGSMLNTAISLGRCGIPVSFISEIGHDEPGRLIFDFLTHNNVDAGYVQRYSDGKTAIALAFLDDENNAAYSFYKRYPKKRLNFDFPAVTENDIVLYGSFYAITPEIHDNLVRFIRHAHEQGALVIYDPNFRKPHLNKIEALRPLILENISLADIVRGSKEDFLLIFGAESAGATYETIKKAGCKNLLYTDKSGADCISENADFHLESPGLIPVSTIGAGDAFNAGVIHALSAYDISAKDISLTSGGKWEQIAGTGIRFATEVCMSLENYVSVDFVKAL
jgi:fructokinase